MGRWSRICLRMAQLWTQAEQRPPAPGVFLSPWSQTRSRTARIQARPRNTGARQPGTPGREVVAVRGGLWGLRIQRFESQAHLGGRWWRYVGGCGDSGSRGSNPRSPAFPLPCSMVSGASVQSTSFSLSPPHRPLPCLPPSRTGMGKQSARRRVPQVFRDSVSPPKGEDPLQDGKHLEAPEEVAGGGCRGESPRSHHGREAYLL